MSEDEILQTFVNKRVDFRFNRRSLRFDLSQALFSSHDVDVGTRLLLKTVVQQVDLTAVSTIYDLGCGVGVLGLSLKKTCPQAAVVLQDRDALAAAFARHNARLNRVADVTVRSGLAFQGLPRRQFDLIVSNLPGKAGQPVLRALLAQMATHLAPEGIAAVVVVQPLAEWVAATLVAQGSTVQHRERGKGHTVFHFRGGDGGETAVGLTPYIRGHNPFQINKTSFNLDTVYNLPEFDTLSYRSALAFTLLKKADVSGDILVWNPGQGHVPVYLQVGQGQHPQRHLLAGRDGLSLQISRHNLLAQGAVPDKIAVHHVPHLFALQERVRWLILFPGTSQSGPWSRNLLSHCATLLTDGGSLIVTARSTFVHRLLEGHNPFAQKRFDRKKHGYRVVLLQR